nr:MAG TPA: hypothetical protein [Caudoviricetes sp.]
MIYYVYTDINHLKVMKHGLRILKSYEKKRDNSNGDD